VDGSLLYSKLVWSGFKDLFNIFLHYLNILFTIVGTEMHSEGKSSTWKWRKCSSSMEMEIVEYTCPF
jgi:hypothetical protein